MTTAQLIRVLELSAAYVGRGMAEGAYTTTVGGDKFPAKLLDLIDKAVIAIRGGEVGIPPESDTLSLGCRRVIIPPCAPDEGDLSAGSVMALPHYHMCP